MAEDQRHASSRRPDIHHAHSTGRMLFGAPKLLQDWDSLEANEENAAQYWELFLDLLLVAAASALTDQFKDKLNWDGFCEFVLFYAILINGWLLYSHHITSRFEDSSFAHTIVLFVYCVGFGVEIVNAGWEDVCAFAVGAILQRVAVMIMLLSFAKCLPRAKYFCVIMGTSTAVTIAAFAVAAVVSMRGMKHGSAAQSVVTTMMWFGALVEFCGEIVLLFSCLDNSRLLPINIEQTKERLGALELICLGETVLSVCMIYRESRLEEHKLEDEQDLGSMTPGLYYYCVLGSSFLLIFMFLLLYFHMQPSPADHAFRRSKAHGTTALILHKVLGLPLLMVGTAIKIVVEFYVVKEEREEQFPSFVTKMMGYSVGGSVLVLLVMRYMHYGGKTEINFGHKVLTLGVDRKMDAITMLWWSTVGAAAFLPLIGVWTGLTVRWSPLKLTAAHALLLFVLCMAESYYSHVLQDGPAPTCLTVDEVRTMSAESEPLVAASPAHTLYTHGHREKHSPST